MQPAVRQSSASCGSKKYISVKEMVPEAMPSARESELDAVTASCVSLASAGQMYCLSQVSSSQSSA